MAVIGDELQKVSRSHVMRTTAIGLFLQGIYRIGKCRKMFGLQDIIGRWHVIKADMKVESHEKITRSFLLSKFLVCFNNMARFLFIFVVWFREPSMYRVSHKDPYTFKHLSKKRIDLQQNFRSCGPNNSKSFFTVFILL
ncbi:hypothetical protein AVEN_53376-1 [Araneus ventricosus]|uniref:Uncharacterized protein n=1 Tax=Araneus ventricosus TaxID=182803 RepID=A0A4Y2AA87_ARAVE|nr:hypothetical protein AVEN_53376-1 [Araneus ventricosus]